MSIIRKCCIPTKEQFVKGGSMKITAIDYIKDQFKITIDSKSYKIFKDTYAEFYLYVDKEINNEELQAILEYDKLFAAKNYAINLLTKKLYLTPEIKSKIQSKYHLSEEAISKIIEELTSSKLLDDQEYIYLYIDTCNQKNWSFERIKYELKQKEVDSTTLNQLVSDYDEELLKAERAHQILVKKHRTKNYQKLNESVRNGLRVLGYQSEIINHVCAISKIEYTQEDEKQKIQKESQKLKLLNKMDNDRIFKRLLGKGYRYELIKEILSEE